MGFIWKNRWIFAFFLSAPLANANDPELIPSLYRSTPPSQSEMDLHNNRVINGRSHHTWFFDGLKNGEFGTPSEATANSFQSPLWRFECRNDPHILDPALGSSFGLRSRRGRCYTSADEWGLSFIVYPYDYRAPVDSDLEGNGGSESAQLSEAKDGAPAPRLVQTVSASGDTSGKKVSQMGLDLAGNTYGEPRRELQRLFRLSKSG